MDILRGMNIMRFSFVIPIYNEEEALSCLFQELSSFLDQDLFRSCCEVILVDDGSTDTSWSMIADKASQDRRIVAVRLSRNFGHQFALTAGYTLSTGEAIICMDADLQDPLPVTLKFIEKWQEGYDIIFGVRIKRRGESFFKITTAKLFYKLISLLGEIKAPQNSGDFRLLSRRALDALNRLPECHRYLRGLVGWIGLKTTYVEFERVPRIAGSIKYPIAKMIRFALDAIVSMSSKPLKFSYYAALFATVVSLGYLLYTLLQSVFMGVKMIPGWSSLIVSIVAFGALNLICLGLIGEYLGRIYEEVKHRPLYLIEKIIKDGKESAVKLDDLNVR
jgi:polyisoprenyl-phosphate glycosyltransferase